MNTNIEQKANGAVENANQSAHAAINAASEKLSAASEKLRPTVDHLTAGAHKVLDRVSSAASQTADVWSEKSEQLKEAQAKLAASTRSYVQEKPIAAIGIAVATGFVLSWLLRKR